MIEKSSAHQLVAVHPARLVCVKLGESLLILPQVAPKTRKLIETQLAGLIHLQQKQSRE